MKNIEKKIQEKSKLEYFHKDFNLLVNSYIQNTTNKPILVKGITGSGKKTMAKQLANIIGTEAINFDFSKTTINGEKFFDQKYLIERLSESENKGQFIIINNFEQLDIYDCFLLMNYFNRIKHNKNPKSVILILENHLKQNHQDFSDIVRLNSAVVIINNDPIIEEIIKKEKESKKKIKMLSN